MDNLLYERRLLRDCIKHASCRAVKLLLAKLKALKTPYIHTTRTA